LNAIGADDDEAVALLALMNFGGEVAFDPEVGSGLSIGRNDGAVGERFEKRMGSTVRAAPGGLARAARTFDHDDHLPNLACCS